MYKPKRNDNNYIKIEEFNATNYLENCLHEMRIRDKNYNEEDLICSKRSVLLDFGMPLDYLLKKISEEKMKFDRENKRANEHAEIFSIFKSAKKRGDFFFLYDALSIGCSITYVRDQIYTHHKISTISLSDNTRYKYNKLSQFYINESGHLRISKSPK